MNECLIKRIRKLTSSLISDAVENIQGEEAVIRNFKPRSSSRKVVGSALTVKMRNSNQKKNFGVFKILEKVKAGQVIFIDVGGRTDVSTFGGLAALICCRKGVAGTVINGACRDIEEISKHKYPVYSKGVTPKTGRSRIELDGINVTLDIDEVKVMPNDLIFADKTGIVRIPQDKVENVLKVAERIRDKESEIEKKAIIELSVSELSRRYKEI